MGDRAVITTRDFYDEAKRDRAVGVYLHWNGDRTSVESLLEYCKLRGFRPPEEDCYGWARLCQVAGNVFGGGLSIGVDTCDGLDCDNWDNGTYIISNWEIVDRVYVRGECSEEVDEAQKKELLLHIDSCQPPADRLWPSS